MVPCQWFNYPAGSSSNVALLGCNLAAWLYEIHRFWGSFSSPSALLIENAKPVDEGCVPHCLFADQRHSNLLCKQQEKRDPGLLLKGRLGLRLQITLGLVSVCKEKCLLVSSPFDRWLRKVIFGFEGLSAKQVAGKTAPVAGIFLASF